MYKKKVRFIEKLVFKSCILIFILNIFISLVVKAVSPLPILIFSQTDKTHSPTRIKINRNRY